MLLHIESAGYTEQEPIVTDVTIPLEKGKLLGLIGANGAGKSTTIKALLGSIPEIAGDLTALQSVRVSSIPEVPQLYDHLTLFEHLAFVGASYGLAEAQWLPAADEMLHSFSLEKHVHERPVNFSKGMKQKTHIILAFMVKPDVLIIDEPFIGLDPIATKRLLFYIEKALHNDCMILMSTHVLDSAEKMCDEFIMLSNGGTIAKGSLEHIRKLAGKSDSASLLDCYYDMHGGVVHE